MEDRFAAFAESLRQELAPAGVLERVLANRVILSAWALETIAEEEHATLRSSSPGPDRRPVDITPRSVFLVAHCLDRALDLLCRLREDDQPRWGRSATAPATAPTTDANDALTPCDEEPEVFKLSNEWPVVPRARRVASPPDPVGTASSPAPLLPSERAGLADRWQDRLVFDLNVSGSSPVVKGTWVTVSHVVSLIVDGWTWLDILRTHPELTEDDIRTCLAYTVAEVDGET